MMRLLSTFEFGFNRENIFFTLFRERPTHTRFLSDLCPSYKTGKSGTLDFTSSSGHLVAEAGLEHATSRL